LIKKRAKKIKLKTTWYVIAALPGFLAAPPSCLES